MERRYIKCDALSRYQIELPREDKNDGALDFSALHAATNMMPDNITAEFFNTKFQSFPFLYRKLDYREMANVDFPPMPATNVFSIERIARKRGTINNESDSSALDSAIAANLPTTSRPLTSQENADILTNPLYTLHPVMQTWSQHNWLVYESYVLRLVVENLDGGILINGERTGVEEFNIGHTIHEIPDELLPPYTASYRSLYNADIIASRDRKIDAHLQVDFIIKGIIDSLYQTSLDIVLSFSCAQALLPIDLTKDALLKFILSKIPHSQLMLSCVYSADYLKRTLQNVRLRIQDLSKVPSSARQRRPSHSKNGQNSESSATEPDNQDDNVSTDTRSICKKSRHVATSRIFATACSHVYKVLCNHVTDESILDCTKRITAPESDIAAEVRPRIFSLFKAFYRRNVENYNKKQRLSSPRDNTLLSAQELSSILQLRRGPSARQDINDQSPESYNEDFNRPCRDFFDGVIFNQAISISNAREPPVKTKSQKPSDTDVTVKTFASMADAYSELRSPDEARDQITYSPIGSLDDAINNIVHNSSMAGPAHLSDFDKPAETNGNFRDSDTTITSAGESEYVMDAKGLDVIFSSNSRVEYLPASSASSMEACMHEVSRLMGLLANIPDAVPMNILELECTFNENSRIKCVKQDQLSHIRGMLDKQKFFMCHVFSESCDIRECRPISSFYRKVPCPRRKMVNPISNPLSEATTFTLQGRDLKLYSAPQLQKPQGKLTEDVVLRAVSNPNTPLWLASLIKNDHIFSTLLTPYKLSLPPSCYFRSGVHGFGLFSLAPISNGSIIVEYLGELISPVIANIREKSYTRANMKSVYMFKLRDDCVIDATMCGNYGRFLNHSCDPFAESHDIFRANNSVSFHFRQYSDPCGVVVKAIRPLPSCSEITQNYNMTKEAADRKISCLCGSSRCKRSLN